MDLVVEKLFCKMHCFSHSHITEGTADPPTPGFGGDFLTSHPSLQHFPKRFCNHIGRYIILSQHLDQCSLRIAEIVITGSVGSVGSISVRGIFATLNRELILNITRNHPGQLFPESRNADHSQQHHRKNEETNGPTSNCRSFILADRPCDYPQHHANSQHHQGGIAGSATECGG